MMTAAQRRDNAKRVRDEISATRHEAQVVRALWPTDDDDLHSKVERVQQALRSLGNKDAARRIGNAHNAAWRKQKRLMVQKCGRSHGLPYHDGDMTQADWWKRACEMPNAARAACTVAEKTLYMANKTGPTSATLRLIDAAYWAAWDLRDDLLDAQGAIPPHDNTLRLFQQLEDWADSLLEAKDDLVSWAEANGHTITRH